MVSTCTKIVFSSKICEVKKTLDYILAYLEEENPYIKKDDRLELRLIYNELLVNAVVHGNKNDPSKKVELLIELDQGCVLSSIKDEGEGFDYLEVLECDDGTEDFMSESGRGLKIVKYLTDYISFNEPGNKIEFRKNVG